ncbi:MAG: hypothetical protein AVDCRST_MAG26-2821, partial [uncultured Chloroflexia bacterium]
GVFRLVMVISFHSPSVQASNHLQIRGRPPFSFETRQPSVLSGEIQAKLHQRL